MDEILYLRIIEFCGGTIAYLKYAISVLQENTVGGRRIRQRSHFTGVNHYIRLK